MLPVLVAWLPLGCSTDDAAPGCTRAARAHTQAVAGDANSDGVVDVADGCALYDAAFGATPVACSAAGDVTADGVVDLGDATALWLHLYAGNTALPTLDLSGCTVPEEDAACGDGLALRLDAPTTTPSEEFDVRVSLTTGPLAVEAWSFGLAASGCTVVSATPDGTQAADRRDGGVRDGGYARTDVTSGGVVAATVLGLADRVVAGDGDVLVVHLRGTCGTACTLAFSDTQAGAGGAVPTVVSAAGRAYVPEEGGASVAVCGG